MPTITVTQPELQSMGEREGDCGNCVALGATICIRVQGRCFLWVVIVGCLYSVIMQHAEF